MKRRLLIAIAVTILFAIAFAACTQVPVVAPDGVTHVTVQIDTAANSDGTTTLTFTVDSPCRVVPSSERVDTPPPNGLTPYSTVLYCQGQHALLTGNLYPSGNLDYSLTSWSP